MRILHTSDWHLGKRLFKLDRTEEHQQFLNWLLTVLIEQQIDVLLLAGDIFDTPTPPHQSLQMFYDFLFRVSQETSTDTYLIAGNHDSGQLLEAPARLLASHRVKVWGKLSPNPADHWLRITKRDTTIDLCGIPFFRSYELLHNPQMNALEALEIYLKRPKEQDIPQVLMLHHLAGIFEAAGSEQVISLSGVDSIPTELLRPFSYVALGHIHKPQRLGEGIYYSGSPIPLRFSETYSKSVIMLSLNPSVLEITHLPIPLARPLTIIKAQASDWREKIAALNPWTGMKPMVEVQITLDAPRAGLIDEIKLALEERGHELLSFMAFYQGVLREGKKNERLFELGTQELFEEFYRTKFPDAPEIPPELKSDFAALLEKVKNAPAAP